MKEMYSTMQLVENYFSMTTCNPETDDMLSQLKAFKTFCAAFPTRVRKLVCKLNGEYGLRMRSVRNVLLSSRDLQIFCRQKI